MDHGTFHKEKTRSINTFFAERKQVCQMGNDFVRYRLTGAKQMCFGHVLKTSWLNNASAMLP